MPSMPSTLELLDRFDPITYESALNKEDNILNQLPHRQATFDLYCRLVKQQDDIAALVRHHLGLGKGSECVLSQTSYWMRGRFNVCIPVKVTMASCAKEFMMRFPMPYKLAEAQYPGTIDEKMNCEVATYAWMQENCSDIRIPFLYGFGFSDDRHYTHVQQRPFYVRLARSVQRFFYRLVGYPHLSHYTINPAPCRLSSAYMLLERIGPEVGQMLSITWIKAQNDDARRKNLFRGISRVMLSLARVPQPRIGSFRFDPDGSIVLGNRPLTCSTIILENDNASRTTQPCQTHRSTETFVADMITLHDNHFLSKPNAIIDNADCHSQMAVQLLLRALSHHFIRRDRRDGPFLIQTTDLHASNIFVDADWNVTCLVDLEWICALPAEMLAVPYWLTRRGIDQITGDHFDEFDKVSREFLQILEQEERSTPAEHGLSLSGITREMWDSKGMWFWLCIESVNASLSVVAQHICPKFSIHMCSDVETAISGFWSVDSARIVKKKLADLEAYEEELKRAFDKASCE